MEVQISQHCKKSKGYPQEEKKQIMENYLCYDKELDLWPFTTESY